MTDQLKYQHWLEPAIGTKLLDDVVECTFRNCLAMGRSFNSGALQRIKATAKKYSGRGDDTIINRLVAAIRIEERDCLRSYWGA